MRVKYERSMILCCEASWSSVSLEDFGHGGPLNVEDQERFTITDDIIKASVELGLSENPMFNAGDNHGLYPELKVAILVGIWFNIFPSWLQEEILAFADEIPLKKWI